MQCPGCGGQLSSVLYEGIDIHHCSSCNGRLLDEQKLSQIEITRKESISRNKEHSKSSSHESLRTCPACNVQMQKSQYGKYTPWIIDKCPQCNNIWLDEGELEDIQVAYELYEENINKGKKPDFNCPKCGFAQVKRSECSKCGIIFAKYDAIKSKQDNRQHSDNLNTAKRIRIPRGLGTLGVIDFVRDEIKGIPSIDKKPEGGIKCFSSRIGYALSLGLKEKEIFVFGLLQWAAIGIAYLLWVQMLDWIPEEVWRSAAESDEGSIADIVLFAWSFVCVGVAAFPIGILTGCMGATHFLHKQGRESTVAMCLKLVLPHSWSLWIFHWIDGWITVNQILERLPGDDEKTAADKALSEALYYAWKLGIAGILPSIVTGNNLIRSAKNSIIFVKVNFLEVAKLRAGYSALCWIVGIGANIGTCFFFAVTDIIPKGAGDDLYKHVYTFYFWAVVPIMVALSVVMLLLRPIYVLSLCDLYSEHLNNRGEKVSLPENPPASISALVAFCILCIFLAIVFGYRDELGITDMLSTPYGQEYIPN